MTRSLEGFLEVLQKVNQENLDFMNGLEANIKVGDEYRKEMEKIRDLINSFDFVKKKPFDKTLLSTPVHSIPWNCALGHKSKSICAATGESLYD